MSKRKHKKRARQPTGSAGVKITNTGYSEGGASRTHAALRGYNPLKSSVRSDVDANLNTLRNRSSDMYINSPIGASAINTNRANVIGAGLQVIPKIDYKLLGMTVEEAKAWQHNTQREFNLWAESVQCDLYRKHSFYDMQDIAYLSYLVDGDAWAAIKYRRPSPGVPYSTRIQLFEASRVCNPGSMAAYSNSDSMTVECRNPDNGNRIVNGVEIDADGAVVAYWIANRVPYDPTNNSQRLEWSRVEAFGRRTGRPLILQVSHEERPEQYRGVPYLAPAIEVLKQVSRYTNAELSAAIIKSFFTLFFTSSGTTNDLGDVLNETYGPAEQIDPDDLRRIEIGPGTLNLLPSGVDVKAVDGSRTQSTFEAFTNSLIAQIGASLGIPSEVLMNRFQSSYSAARAALLQASAMFRTRRTWFARDFCQPIYEAWLTEAIAIGRIRAPGFGMDPLITKAWAGANWYGPVMGMLDPVKEVNGAALRVKYGFSTAEREAAELTGSNYDDNVDQIASERAVWVNNGMNYPKADNTEAPDTGEGGDTG